MSSTLVAIKETNKVSGVGVPSFHLSFDELQSHMESFQQAIQQTISNSKDTVASARNDFDTKLQHNKDTEQALLEEIEQLHRHGIETTRLRADQLRDLEESKSAIGSYSSKRNQMIEVQRALERRVSEVREAIERKREESQRQRSAVQSQSALNGPELVYWQEVLGLDIQGVSNDFLKFVFTKIDASDSAREFYFVLDLREDNYKVSECQPALDASVLQPLVDALCATRQLNLFLRDMRRAFKLTL